MKRNLDLKQGGLVPVLIMVFLLITMIALLLTTGYLSRDTKTNSVEKNFYPELILPLGKTDTENEHEVVAKNWLAALQHEVVEKTKDSQATTIYKMLKENSIVVSPDDTGFWSSDKDVDSKSLRILPLIPSDRKYTFPLWQRFFQSDIAGAFVSDERLVVIKEDTLTSSVFKGLILVHEGNHALKYLEHPYTERSNKAFSEEERDTHEFVARLMAMIGGTPYEQLLSSEVQRMTTIVKQTAEGMQFSPSGKYHAELDSIFSPALSDSEKEKREKLLWLDTVFHFIDKYYDGNQEEKEEVKAEFLLAIYIAQGMREPEKT